VVGVAKAKKYRPGRYSPESLKVVGFFGHFLGFLRILRR
jgi:hypothetical protein